MTADDPRHATVMRNAPISSFDVVEVLASQAETLSMLSRDGDGGRGWVARMANCGGRSVASVREDLVSRHGCGVLVSPVYSLCHIMHIMDAVAAEMYGTWIRLV